MENAKDLFSTKPDAKKLDAVSIEAMQPKSRPEFEAFAKAVSTKLVQFEVCTPYAPCHCASDHVWKHIPRVRGNAHTLLLRASDVCC